MSYPLPIGGGLDLAGRVGRSVGRSVGQGEEAFPFDTRSKSESEWPTLFISIKTLFKAFLFRFLGVKCIAL